MDNFKKGHIFLFAVTVIITVSVRWYWTNICGGHACSVRLIDNFLQPLLWGGVALTIITGTILFYPSFIFKRWLYYIFSWGFPLALYTILATDPRSSNILSFDRGQVAWLFGTAFFALTVLYIIGIYGYRMYKKSLNNLNLTQLFFLIPSSIIFYSISTYFW